MNCNVCIFFYRDKIILPCVFRPLLKRNIIITIISKCLSFRRLCFFLTACTKIKQICTHEYEMKSVLSRDSCNYKHLARYRETITQLGQVTARYITANRMTRVNSTVMEKYEAHCSVTRRPWLRAPRAPLVCFIMDRWTPWPPAPVTIITVCDCFLRFFSKYPREAVVWLLLLIITRWLLLNVILQVARRIPSM